MKHNEGCLLRNYFRTINYKANYYIGDFILGSQQSAKIINLLKPDEQDQPKTFPCQFRD